MNHLPETLPPDDLRTLRWSYSILTSSSHGWSKPLKMPSKNRPLLVWLRGLSSVSPVDTEPQNGDFLVPKSCSSYFQNAGVEPRT